LGLKEKTGKDKGILNGEETNDSNCSTKPSIRPSPEGNIE